MTKEQRTKKSKLIVCLIICIVMIVSCSSPKPLPINTPVRPIDTEVLPTLTASPTMVFPSTPSPEPLQTPIIEQCLKISDSFPEGSDAEGLPVLWGKALSPYAAIFNFKTGKTEKIPAQRVKDFSAPSVTVSPDQTKVAYFDRSTGEVIIKNSELQELNTIKLSHEEDSYLSWLDNDNLLVIHSAWRDPTPQPAVILNTTTGEQKVITSDYPDLFWKHNFPPDIPVFYDQQLTRALYPIQNGDVYTLALWDLQNNNLVAQHDNIQDFGRNPQWSPHGEQIAFVNDPRYSKGKSLLEYDLYAIDTDGNLEQLTSLLSSNPRRTYPSFFITNFSWSPDGRYIAFWFTNSTGYLYQDFQLGVLDLQTKQVTNYCGLDVTDTHNREIADELKPVWSPDGSQLLVMTRLKKEQLSYNEMINGIDKDAKVFLVDLPSGTAAPMLDNLYPVGWLK